VRTWRFLVSLMVLDILAWKPSEIFVWKSESTLLLSGQQDVLFS